MFKVKVYTLKDAVDPVLIALQASESLHPVTTRQLDQAELMAIQEKVRQVKESLARTTEILASLEKEKVVVIGKVDPYTLNNIIEKYGKLTEEIYRSLKGQEEDCRKLSDEIAKVSEEVKILQAITEVYPELTISSLNYDGDLLFSSTIIANRETCAAIEKTLSDRFSLILKAEEQDQGAVVFTVYGFTRDKHRLLELVKTFGASFLSLPKSDILVSEEVKIRKRKLEVLQSRERELRTAMQASIEKNVDEIVLYREILENELERLRVLELASKFRFSIVVEGYIPENERDRLLASLNKSVSNYYVDFEYPKERDVPSKLDNLGPIKAFEMITNFYGTPEYNEWDPTPLVAYSFTLFFSLMLGDVVYGIVLLFAAAFVVGKLVDDPESQGFLLFRRFLYIIALGSIIGGVLSGSYAGDMPRLLGIEVKPILSWFADPVQLIIFSMIIGIFHVNIAHFVRFVNFARSKNMFGAIGVIVFFIVEVFGISYILRTLLRYNVALFEYTPKEVLLYVTLMGLAIYVLCKVKAEGTFGVFLWIFDLSTLLGDVLSYSRLAGVGLAGVLLASSFNILCKMVFQGMYGISPGIVGIVLGMVFGIAVFVLGHLINVALSALGSYVHSLRLCFVEFLPKFCSGSGSNFSPMKLEISKRIVVGAPRHE